MEGIDSLFVTSITRQDESLPENFLATVGAVYDDGLSLILEGQTEATTKHYKCNTSIKFTAGDRVKVARISGSYVVEYIVGPPSAGGGYPDRIVSGAYGLRVAGDTLRGIKGTEWIGTAEDWFNVGAFKTLYICYDSIRRATLACNSSGKLLVNGTVIG